VKEDQKVIEVNAVTKVFVVQMVMKVLEVIAVNQDIKAQQGVLVFLLNGKVLGKKINIINKMTLYFIMVVLILL
jgi:hypothetical protein